MEVKRNEETDKCAKEVTKGNIININKYKIPHSDIKEEIVTKRNRRGNNSRIRNKRTKIFY